MAAVKTAIESNRGYSLMETGANALSNSTSETALFSQVIPAGKMGTNKILSFELICEVVTPVLSAGSVTVKLNFGGSSIVITNTLALALNLSSGRPFIVRGKIANLSSTNAQYALGEIRQYANDIPILVSTGSSLNGANWSIDTTVDQTFSITATLSVLNATTIITPKIATIELS